METKDIVFGLDIGTRNVIGTVGYLEGDEFHVIAQDLREHDTRAMLDGQIHDIGRVGATCDDVKKELEAKTGLNLTCTSYSHHSCGNGIPRGNSCYR